MNRVRNFALLIRNNWKKSVFFSGVAAYGASLVTERVKINSIMRVYCEEAARFGDQPLGPLSLPRHVTVILNPEANKKKAKIKFEKYAAPILHCAGLKVSVVTTEAKGQSQELMNIMSDTDAVVIAGGDGTVHESVTGLLNRADGVHFPMGIIPLGIVNSASRTIHESGQEKGSKAIRELKAIADATLSVVKESVKQIDLLKIESGSSATPCYAVDSLNFGLIRDVLAKADKYWYFGNKMKPYLAMSSHIVWKGFEDLAIDKAMQIQYTRPCTGCSTCAVVQVADEAKPIENKRWWSAFVPRAKPGISDQKSGDSETKIDYSAIHNPECGTWHSLDKLEDTHPINLIINNHPLDHDADLLLHDSDKDSLSKGSLILDAVDVRNGLPPKDTTHEIKFKDLKISFAPELDQSSTSTEFPASETHVNERISEANISNNDTSNEENQPNSTADSKVPEQKPKCSTVCIDNEEYPVADLTVTRIRKAVTVYSLPYPLFRF